MWRPQSYRRLAKQKGIDPAVTEAAIAVTSKVLTVSPSLPTLLTLRHLAHLVQVDYGLLRAIVSRKVEDPYKVFRIHKRVPAGQKSRFRIICVPEPTLMKVQRWINERILSAGPALGYVHPASVAYSKGSSIYTATKQHCGCRWLIKLDIINFFESISEIPVYKTFLSFGYEPLIAFELARLCTRLGTLTKSRRRWRWQSNSARYLSIPAYRFERMGHLPQGAPTSPMLANLSVRSLDERIDSLADNFGLVYTRYADDIVLSTNDGAFTRDIAQDVIGRVYQVMVASGLSPNTAKTHIASPGSRKIVLGLQVDGEFPRLTRKFKDNLRQHLHFLLRGDVGPTLHARHRRFSAVIGLRKHIEGLVAFARYVEPAFGNRCDAELAQVQWPI
jgi:RNA-directed DNA polymerase